jgi:hypothetical protein
MAEMDQINVSTHRYIRENPALVDNYFQHDPFLAYCKLNLREEWGGGSADPGRILLLQPDRWTVGKGQEFDITEKQVEQGCQFVPKIEEVNVTLSKEDIQVFNTGPRGFPADRLPHDQRIHDDGRELAIGLYLQGQTASTLKSQRARRNLPTTAPTRWDGQVYSTYGGITRGGTVGLPSTVT